MILGSWELDIEHGPIAFPEHYVYHVTFILRLVKSFLRVRHWTWTYCFPWASCISRNLHFQNSEINCYWSIITTIKLQNATEIFTGLSLRMTRWPKFHLKRFYLRHMRRFCIHRAGVSNNYICGRSKWTSERVFESNNRSHSEGKVLQRMGAMQLCWLFHVSLMSARHL